MSRILVTGCSDLVSHQIITSVPATENEILTVSNGTEKAGQWRGAAVPQMLQGHFSDKHLFDHYREFKPDIIIHSAISPQNKYVFWKDYLKYNVHGTERLLRFAIECNVKLFIFISGADIYGTIPARLPADPWTAANPEDYYQQSKWKAEQLVVKLLRGRIPFVILRPSRIYGEEEHGFLAKLTYLVKTNTFPLIRKGVKIHLTDVKTVGRVVQWLLNSEMPDEAIYNVADRSPVPLSELVDLIYSFFYSKNYIDYLRLHPVFFKMGENVSRVLQLKQLSLDFKQISESWYYDITNLSEVCPFELPLTMERVAYYLELQHKAVGN